jgi:uncharacterized OsmC-like protein
MNADELRALQAPLTLRAQGQAGEGVTFRVETRHGIVEAGLHPAAGGDGGEVCAGEILLEALIACAGVTLRAVATAMGIPLRGAAIHAEGDMDMRGTLGVSKDVPVGFQTIRLHFDLDTTATPEQIATLLRLTERYCVVYQTLRNPPSIQVSQHATAAA